MCKESIPIITCNIKGRSLRKVISIKSTSLTLIRLWGKVVYYVEKKSYVDKLDARKPRDFTLFNTSREFLIDPKDFYRIFHRLFHII